MYKSPQNVFFMFASLLHKELMATTLLQRVVKLVSKVAADDPVDPRQGAGLQSEWEDL